MEIYMAGDGKITARAMDALQRRKTEREAMYRRRREDVFARNSAAKELDGRIRALPVQALRATLEGGDDAQEKIALIKHDSFLLREELARELALMGLPHDWLEEDYYCKKCRDTGYVDGRMCACLKELVAKEQTKELSSLLDMGGETFSSFRLSMYDDKPDPVTHVSPRAVMEVVLGVCKRFARDFGAVPENLLMSGGTGLGKTFLSTCIANEVSKAGYSVVYASAASCFARFEDEKFSRYDTEAQEDVDRYLNCDLLIIDDLGTEMTTSFTVSALYRIVNTRLMRRKSTIISTNLQPEDISGRYSAAIYSRIVGEYKFLKFVGRDIRTMGSRNG